MPNRRACGMTRKTLVQSNPCTVATGGDGCANPLDVRTKTIERKRSHVW